MKRLPFILGGNINNQQRHVFREMFLPFCGCLILNIPKTMVTFLSVPIWTSDRKISNTLLFHTFSPLASSVHLIFALFLPQGTTWLLSQPLVHRSASTATRSLRGLTREHQASPASGMGHLGGHFCSVFQSVIQNFWE